MYNVNLTQSHSVDYRERNVHTITECSTGRNMGFTCANNTFNMLRFCMWCMKTVYK